MPRPWVVLVPLLLASCAGERSDYPYGSDAGQGSTATAPSGLPCDVAQILQAHCTSCHSDPPMMGVPMGLATYADLTAASAAYPGETYAQRSLTRMQAGTMPPGGGTSAQDLSTFQAWVVSGTPQGSCGASAPDGGTSSVPNSAPVCTSGVTWTGDDGSSLMHPGMACIACHTQGGSGGEGEGGPSFSAAGTVYPTTHEPNDCYGIDATVTITDASGATYAATANRAGNFSFRQALQFPITASVSSNGRTRPMATPQMSGDCNSCHTQKGAFGAPGRIVAP